MNSRIPHISLIYFLLLVPFSFAEDSDPAQAAAGALASIRGSGKACPPSWSDGVVGRVERLELTSGTWHLVYVTAGGKPAGYILLWRKQEITIPVMYSGSEFSSKLAEQVTPPEEPMGLGSLLPTEPPDLRMIALPKLRNGLGNSQALASCVAGMSMWIQEHHRIPLLYLPPELAIQTTRPFDMNSPLVSPSPHSSVNELASFNEQRSKVYQDPELWESSPPPVGSQPWYAPPGSRKRPKDRTRVSERLGEVVQHHLMQDLSRQSRWSLMRDEYVVVSDRLEGPHSEGMASTVVIQNYLSAASNIKEGLDAFGRSRGLQSVWSWGNSSSLRPDMAPCVLISPSEQAVLVAWMSRSPESKWALVIVPETVRPIQRSRKDLAAEALQTMRKLKGSPEAAEPGMFDDPAIRRKMEELLRDGNSPYLQGSVVSDPTTHLPAALAQGAHFVNFELFAGWSLISVAEAR